MSDRRKVVTKTAGETSKKNSKNLKSEIPEKIENGKMVETKNTTSAISENLNSEKMASLKLTEEEIKKFKESQPEDFF